MSKIIQIKRGNGTPPELQYGEPAFDNENKKLYVGSEDGTPIKIGGMADNAIADSEGNNIVETYVKNIDYATYDKAGILSVGNGLIIENDKIHIDEATEVELEEKCECHRSITPDYIDTAVYYSTHQDMSDDYLVTNLKTSDKFEGTEGELPVSYNAVKNYIDNFSVDVIDNLTSEDINKALSANQGRILNETKADKSTTLEGYGITDSYTKNEVATELIETKKYIDEKIGTFVTETGINIFDMSQQIAPDIDDEGNIIDGTGTIIPHCFLDGKGGFSHIADPSSSIYNRYFVSNKIFIEPNKHYISVWGGEEYTNHIFDAPGKQAWIYDSQEKPLVSIDLYDNPEFDTPADASYIRIAICKGNTKPINEVIDIVFGPAMIVEGSTLPETYMPYGPGGTYLNENIIIPQLENITSLNLNHKIRIKKEGSTINILYWYGKKVMCIQMKQKHINNLFDFYRWYISKEEPTELIPFSEDNFNLITSNNTDFLGPHVVWANNNADGDFSDTSKSIFTGGVHGYNNTSTTPTARCSHISMYADGKMLPETYSGFCSSLKIRWENYLQGLNTQKEDGSGREILKEEYTIIFNGDKFDISYDMTALEDITHKTFYGLQCSNGCWNEGIYYIGSKVNIGLNPSGIASNSGHISSYTELSEGDKNCTKIKRVGANHILEMGINKNVGLGDFYYLGSIYGSASSSTIKTYFNLISKPVNMPTNSKLGFEGYYKFYPNINSLV